MTKVNNLFSVIFISLSVESFVLGLVYNSFLPFLLVGLPTTLAPLYFFKQAPDSALTKHVVAIALMIFAALHIHQAEGLIEIHFEIFILMALLIIYQNWSVFVTALVVIALHHATFFIMQVNSVEVMVFDKSKLTISILIIHALYAALEAVVGAYIAILMKKQSRTGEELTSLTNSIVADPERINLKVQSGTKNDATLASFDSLISILAILIGTIKQQVEDLRNSSLSLEKTKHRFQKSSSERQAEIEVIATAAEEISVTISSISEETQTLHEQMHQANTLAQNTNLDMEQVAKHSNYLTESINETADQMHTLIQSVNTISGVLSEITSIAEQTNLLALNAAIEAARAGDAGRGFAVVADEVRALANSTTQSTQKISEIIGNLQRQSRASTESMETSLKVITTVISDTEQAKEKIMETSNLVSNATNISVTVAAAVEQQAVTMAGIAESSESLRKRTEFDNQVMKELSKDALDLKRCSAELEENASKFR
ncbi:methyl-accepting chemotaxis protein [Alteromonas gracilis]|uniref:methyl-accepting chemotaxis protein n=1 Tax=Alteromonas gracilis TaxID=1479524 RepID=UPI0030CE7294